MVLSQYTPIRADAINQLNIPNADKPYRVKFLWFDIVSRDHGAQNIYDGEHSHSFFELHMMFFGEISYEINGEIFTLSQGEALLLPPNIPHRYIASDDFFLKASLAFLPEDIPWEIEKHKKFCFSDEVIQNVESILRQSELNDVFAPAIISGRLMEILAISIRENFDGLPSASRLTEDRRITVAKDYIRNNRSRLITCKDVAKEICLSSKQLNRIFKAQTGKTAYDYITDVRIEYAKQLLLDDVSIKQVSFTLGFGNESSVVSFFKRPCKMPPGEYKKSVKLQINNNF